MKLGRRRAMIGSALFLGCGKTVGDSSFHDGPATNDAGPLPPAYVGPTTQPNNCRQDGSTTIFGADIRAHTTPAASVFYSWTTAEQVAEIKQSKSIFTRTERPGLGPGYAMDLFAARAGDSTEDARLAKALSGDTFAKARYAWTAAWSTRMGWPAESYGNELLRIELKPEAWIVAYVGDRFSAFDMANVPVPLADVLAAPQRIGAVYFVQDRIYAECTDAGIGGSFNAPIGGGGDSFGPYYCNNPPSRGYREYILGSDAMVASFSHGTEESRAEIERSRTLLDQYRALALAWSPDPNRAWNAEVVSGWSSSAWEYACDSSEYLAYRQSLAIPSSLYEPTQGNLQAMIDTLKNDPFTLDPFVVKR